MQLLEEAERSAGGLVASKLVSMPSGDALSEGAEEEEEEEEARGGVVVREAAKAAARALESAVLHADQIRMKVRGVQELMGNLSPLSSRPRLTTAPGTNKPDRLPSPRYKMPSSLSTFLVPF